MGLKAVLENYIGPDTGLGLSHLHIFPNIKKSSPLLFAKFRGGNHTAPNPKTPPITVLPI